MIGPSISVSQQVCQAHHHKRHESAAWPNKACPIHRPHTAAAAARATRGHNAVSENAQRHEAVKVVDQHRFGRYDDDNPSSNQVIPVWPC